MTLQNPVADVSLEMEPRPVFTIPVDLNGNYTPPSATIPTTSTSTLTSVVAASASTQLLAGNTARKGMYVYNDSTATLYLAFGGTASATVYTTQVPPQGFFEMPTAPVYLGVITGYWASANGNARLTELT